MAIWEFMGQEIRAASSTTFGAEGVREREDLQRLLRDQIDVICPDTLVIAEEYGDWSDSRRRIDLLGLDRSANLVVVELKRTEDGGLMDLQAVRYAAMVSAMTYAKAVETFQRYMDSRGDGDDAEAQILEFLEWDEPDEDEFANEVSIVLASAEFSRELTTSVIWLNDQGLDVRCIRIRPYRPDEHLLLDVQQVLPLPEAEQYQVQLRQKAVERRRARSRNMDLTRFDLRVGDRHYPNLWKRHLIYRIVRSVVDAGVKPDEVATHLPRGASRFVSVDGECGEAEFLARLAKLRTGRGNAYQARRFFTSDDELIRFDGRTYALSNQWSKKALEPARKLAGAFPDLRIEFSEAGGTDDGN